MKKSLLTLIFLSMLKSAIAQVSIPFYYNFAPNGTSNYNRASDGATFGSGDSYLTAGGGSDGTGGCIERGVLEGPVFTTEGGQHPDQDLYMTECWGGGSPSTITVEVPLSNGFYDVVYHGIEMWFGVGTQGMVCGRTFDIYAEGEVVYADFDIWAQVGEKVGLAYPIHDIEVADGSLTLSGVATANNPVICALEVLSAGALPDNGNPVTTTSSPVDITVCVATIDTFTIHPPFPGNITSQAIQINRIDGSGWVSVSGISGLQVIDDNSVIVDATLSMEGYLFRSVVGYTCNSYESPNYTLHIDTSAVNGCPTTHCFNGVQDGDETDIDCGGTCVSCTPPSHCFNLVQDGDETGVDCGGSCTSCGPPAHCFNFTQDGNETGVDCGGSCTSCGPPAHCSNLTQDGNETGVDCGGSCDACPTSSCNNLVQDGDETGIDCGGSCGTCTGSPDTVMFRYNFAPNGTANYVRLSDGAVFLSGESYLTAGGGSDGTGGCIERGILEAPIFTTEGGQHPDQDLYMTECWGGGNPSTLTIEIPIANGSYDLIYHAVEMWFGVGTQGIVCGRTFDIYAEGEVMYADFDIWSQVGEKVGLAYPLHDINVADGSLTLSGIATANNAVISAIEVLSAGALPDNGSPLTTSSSPVDITICVTAIDTFTIHPPFPGNITSQAIQVNRIDGSGWISANGISGFQVIDNNSVIVDATLSMEGYLFRSVVGYTCNSHISSQYTLQIDTSASNCQMVQPQCDNGIQDGDETGVDCGGSCNPCGPPAHCFNFTQDGDEIDIDCGGSCDSCPNDDPPSTPQNLQATSIAATSVILTWEASVDDYGVMEYDVYLDGLLDGTSDSLLYTTSGLQPATLYRFNVIAKDVAGNSSLLSDTLQVTTLEEVDTLPPTVPLNLYADDVTDSSISVIWDASVDDIAVTGYNISLTDHNLVVTMFETSSTNYIIDNLNASSLYTITVSAEDVSGNISGQSNDIEILTLPLFSQPLSSTDLSDEVVLDTTISDALVMINWDAPDNAETLIIHVTPIDSTLRTQEWMVVIPVNEDGSYTVNGLSPGTSYEIVIEAVDNLGNKLLESEPISFTAGGIIAGIQNNLGDLSIHPNPTSGTIQLSGTDIESVTIYNMIGNLVYQGSARNGEIIDLKSLGLLKGIYLAVISTSTDQYSIKLILK